MSLRTTSTIPAGYTVPPFPSLYYPLPISSTHGHFLYKTSDAWRFTLLWTLIFYAALHLCAGLYAVAMQPQNWRYIWVGPVVFLVVGGVEAVVAGSVVGALLGALYEAGNFRMSTWIPFVWALINSLVVILSSFAIQGGL